MCAISALLIACNKPEPRPLAPPPPVLPPPPTTNGIATNAVEPAKPASPEMPALPEMVATIQGGDVISVKAPQSGYLVRQAYKDGATVAAGDVLFLLDPRMAHEAMSVDKSALIRITSPIAGVPGDAWHGAGDRIEAGMELVGVARIDEVDANVTLPGPLAQQFVVYLDRLTAAHFPLRPNIELILPDGGLYGEKGTLGTMPSSGGIHVLSITFPNPRHILQPGEFVKVRSAAP